MLHWKSLSPFSLEDMEIKQNLKLSLRTVTKSQDKLFQIQTIYSFSRAWEKERC